MNSIAQRLHELPSLRPQVPDDEWKIRVELAAAYRLAHSLKWTDHISTHFSARAPGPHEHFLINAYGLTFSEVTASNLVKVDISGEIISDPLGLGINRAGYVIHSALHAARHDAMCVLHTHTAAGIGVAAQRDGLLMISQHAMHFFDRISYHAYEGIAADMEEQKRLVSDLGDNDAFILRNHGLLTCGPSIAHAFTEMFLLERACMAQIAAQACTAPLLIAPDDVARKVASLVESPRWPGLVETFWDAMMRELHPKQISHDR